MLMQYNIKTTKQTGVEGRSPKKINFIMRHYDCITLYLFEFIKMIIPVDSLFFPLESTKLVPVLLRL